MDPNQTPKRKRKRMETATPSKSGGPASRTPNSGGAESTIVWKDSPADKQIRVSGTGKIAVRKEIQGFVGRLARASQQSPPEMAGERRERPLHALAKRKAALESHLDRVGNGSDAHGSTHRKPIGALQYDDGDESISRHLLFSPDSRKPKVLRTTGNNVRTGTASSPLHPNRLKTAVSPGNHQPRSTPDKTDSPDELFTVLDQMEQKYASPDVAVPLASATMSSRPVSESGASQPPPPAGVSVSTPPLSYSSTGTVSPRAYVTPEKTPELPSELISEEFGSPLTTESWALLDQLEYQASQRGVNTEATQHQTQTLTQMEADSSQTLELTPRPLPSSSAVAPNGLPAVTPSVASASAVRTIVSSDSAQQPEGYQRFLVLEVDRDVFNRSLLLRLLDGQELHVEAVLMDDWYDVTVEAGDTINVVFTEQDGAGFFSQEDGGQNNSRPSKREEARIRIDNERNVVIVHPDILVSPTSVTTSFGCLRRAILRETLAVGRSTHPKAFLGTLKHDLFEYALLNRVHDTGRILGEAKRIVNTNILGLVDCGLNEETALLELSKVAEDYRSWLSAAVAGPGALLNEPPPKTGARVQVSRVLATEDMMWSIKWGLKGATDASVEGTITSQEDRNGDNRVVLPLELKTGSKVYAGVEHQGQVILYTLLLNERYRQRCQDGLLLYVPGIETNRISAMATHIRGLIMSRNHFASAMAKVKAVGSSTSSQVFPSMIRSRRECERCFQMDECVLHHAATENGTAESSGLDELFTQKTQHLNAVDLEYFKQWNRLIDLEQQHAEKNLRALWLQVGWKREQAQESAACIAHLKLVADKPAHSESGAKRTLRFIRDRRKRPWNSSMEAEAQVQPSSFAGVRFRVDERVILSAESLDGKKLLVHISRATVRAIEHGLLTIETRQSIPSVVTSGQSVVGNEFTWRLDKDAVMSGLRRAKENLVRLFIGPPPEVVSAGTALTNRSEVEMLVRSVAIADEGGGGSSSGTSGMGDTRRRRLIVHLTRPRFKSSRVSEQIKQRCQKCTKDDHDGRVSALGQALLDAFYQLNVDQQRAVQRVLSSLDYALVLGMPGTGKTATIAFTVRVLLFLGFSVLVTSYTHSAVDNLLLKLLACEVPMLRIGNPAQVHPLIADFTLEQQAHREGIASVQAMEARMINAQLVGCTCLSVNSHVLFAKRRFDFCIVDEATQITQPVVMGALRCADTFVLVGDHYQLPPLVANAQARKEGMDVSLFRRLAEAHPEASQQLSYQYRMNRDIMLLANRLVYGDKLKCGSFGVASNHLKLRWRSTQQQEQSANGHDALWPVRVLTNNQGVVFLDTDSMGGEAAESSSASQKGRGGRRRMENVVEAQVIAGLVELLVLGGVPSDEIAAISPFRSQVALIQQHLATAAASRKAGGVEWLEAVEVSTIDKYQGKDKDVILVSFVRCNEEKRVGELLTDWRRINVALTRAKQKLLLVGSQSTLSGGSALFQVLSHVVQQQHWGFKLPRGAVESLRLVAERVAGQPLEPEPERYTELVAKRRGKAANDSVQVSFLRREPAAHSGDIEALVPNVSTASLRSHAGARPSPMKPITRDIFSDL